MERVPGFSIAFQTTGFDHELNDRTLLWPMASALTVREPSQILQILSLDLKRKEN